MISLIHHKWRKCALSTYYINGICKLLKWLSVRTAINNHSTRSLVEKHTTHATKILRGILMPMESTCMLFIIMMLQCPCMQARRDSPPRSPNATGSVAVQDSHRPVRPSTGSTAGGPTDADVDAHQETCSRDGSVLAGVCMVRLKSAWL